MAYYKDLREFVAFLESKDKLYRIRREINKDTELHPLVRWQFRGLKEEQRRAFIFENVVDIKGKKYSIPVLVACHAPSREVYAMGLQCEVGEIYERWVQGERHPIASRLVNEGPVHEEVHIGKGLLEHGGLSEFPVPISTPGFDNAPYLTAANWVTKDPETGARNVGNYRAMVKSPTRLGIMVMAPQHMRTHWEKYRKLGKPMEAAVVLGPPPNIGYVATGKVPYGADEIDVAGGMVGEAVEMVKCKTVDLEVPATTEIVLEGIVPTDSLEREAPFGEFSGYMGMHETAPYFEITAITHRRNPMFTAFLSQFPPSESSNLRGIAFEGVFYKFLKYDCNITGILEVVFHPAAGAQPLVIIKMKKTYNTEAWQALNAAVALVPQFGKIIITVDEDIDARDLESVMWAVSFRMQPHRDTRITMGKVSGLDPSSAPMTVTDRRYLYPTGDSAILIDATMKWDYPPVSLPRKDFMERAKEIWELEELPTLTPKVPWHGYPLGFWTDQNREEAEIALQGDHYLTGEKLAKEERVKLEPPSEGSQAA